MDRTQDSQNSIWQSHRAHYSQFSIQGNDEFRHMHNRVAAPHYTPSTYFQLDRDVGPNLPQISPFESRSTEIPISSTNPTNTLCNRSASLPLLALNPSLSSFGPNLTEERVLFPQAQNKNKSQRSIPRSNFVQPQAPIMLDPDQEFLLQRQLKIQQHPQEITKSLGKPQKFAVTGVPANNQLEQNPGRLHELEDQSSTERDSKCFVDPLVARLSTKRKSPSKPGLAEKAPSHASSSLKMSWPSSKLKRERNLSLKTATNSAPHNDGHQLPETKSHDRESELEEQQCTNCSVGSKYLGKALAPHHAKTLKNNILRPHSYNYSPSNNNNNPSPAIPLGGYLTLPFSPDTQMEEPVSYNFNSITFDTLSSSSSNPSHLNSRPLILPELSDEDLVYALHDFGTLIPYTPAPPRDSALEFDLVQQGPPSASSSRAQLFPLALDVDQHRPAHVVLDLLEFHGTARGIGLNL